MDFILKVPEMVELDGEMYIEDIHLSPGGSALNFAVNLSQQGINTGLMGRIGNDEYTDIILNQLANKNVDISRLIKINYQTGQAFINVDKTGRRSIYSFMGANENFKLTLDDIEYIKSAKMLHLTGMYWEVALDVAKHINRLSFSPGGILSIYGIEKLEPVLKKTELLFLNEREIKILTGKNTENEIDDVYDFLIDTGVSNLVLTKGDKGASFYSKKEQVSVSAKKVKVLDTTGAGDAFAAGFVSKWFFNKSVEQCLEFGNKLASECIQILGAF
jgi:sugar/nucleoside kinase (ribokinase family)